MRDRCDGATSRRLTRPTAIYVGLCLALLIFSNQTTPPDYRGDIRESDIRVSEIFESIRKQPGEVPPEELRLRYSGPRGDYIAFYDLEGRDIYFRYREDRFDRRAEKKIQTLISGEAYRVKGEFQGVVLDGVFFEAGTAEYREAIQEKGGVLAYTYGSAFPLRMEQILY